MNFDCPTQVSEINQAAVREQLGRMLAHPVFKASRRCQILLQYLVEYALRGETVHPKERTLGVEVFGRTPDYDTNDDPVVRTTSSDIRKRIAQYYHELQHEVELRIDLPLGSYLLEFHLPELQLTEASAPLPVPVPVEEEAAPIQALTPTPPVRKSHSRFLVILAVSVVVLCGFGFYRVRMESPLDRFWNPMLERPGSLSVCIPVASAGVPPNSSPAPVESPLGIPFVSLTDNTALVQLLHFLDARNVSSKVKLLSFSFSDVKSPSAAPLLPSLAELRNGPVIFIGNSDWSLRLLSPLRFHIVGDYGSGLYWVEDRQNPSAKSWGEKIAQPYNDYAQDYAIISRFFDPVTGQIVVAVSGLGLHATAAAAEFITDPSYMDQVAAGDSRDWQKKNLQIVISTKIAGESWGPPQILAKYFW